MTIRAGQDVGGVGGVDADLGQQGHAERRRAACPGRRRRAGRSSGAGAVWAIAGGERDRGGHRQEREAGLDGREAERLLQVVGEEEEDAEHARAGDADRRGRRRRGCGRRGRAAAAAAWAERRWISDEGDQQDDAGGEEAERDAGAPAVGLGLGEAVDEGEQAAGRGERAGDVERGRDRAAIWLCSSAHRGQRGGDGEDEVDVHAPAPGQVLGEDAAEQQAERAAGAGDARRRWRRRCRARAGR